MTNELEEETEVGTALFQTVINRPVRKLSSSDLQRKVWSPTPWMVDFQTGSIDDDPYNRIRQWLRENCGMESSPIHNQQGNWHFGSATVNGFTWVGFVSEEMMNRFLEEWIPKNSAGGLPPGRGQLADL